MFRGGKMNIFRVAGDWIALVAACDVNFVADDDFFPRVAVLRGQSHGRIFNAVSFGGDVLIFARFEAKKIPDARGIDFRRGIWRMCIAQDDERLADLLLRIFGDDFSAQGRRN